MPVFNLEPDPKKYLMSVIVSAVTPVIVQSPITPAVALLWQNAAGQASSCNTCSAVACSYWTTKKEAALHADRILSRALDSPTGFFSTSYFHSTMHLKSLLGVQRFWDSWLQHADCMYRRRWNGVLVRYCTFVCNHKCKFSVIEAKAIALLKPADLAIAKYSWKAIASPECNKAIDEE